MGTQGRCPGAHANLCMLCTTCILKFNNGFVGSTNTINICLILSIIYIVIPVSCCVGSDLSTLLCTGAYDAVKIALYIGIMICCLVNMIPFPHLVELNLTSPHSPSWFNDIRHFY